MVAVLSNGVALPLQGGDADWPPLVVHARSAADLSVFVASSAGSTERGRRVLWVVDRAAGLAHIVDLSSGKRYVLRPRGVPNLFF
jgi:hypothetical protein